MFIRKTLIAHNESENMSKPNIETLQAHQSPGCFGSPSCYASNSNFCQTCEGFNECGEESLNTLKRIKEVVNVDDLLHKHNQALAKQRVENKKRLKALKTEPPKMERPTPKSVERTAKKEVVEFSIDEKTAELIGELPVKARPFAISLCRKGLVDRIKKDLVRNVNPLSGCGPVFLSIAIESLIAGGFTKSELREIYMKDRGWTENTAASHVSLVVKLFLMFDIAIENNQKFTASPTLLCENK